MKYKRTKKTHRRYRKHLHAAAKVHSVATILFLGFYFSFAFVFGPKILWDDALHKYESVKAAIVNVTAYVPGPPGKPEVSVSSKCTSNYAAYVKLGWAATIDTDNYDIYRGGELLAENTTATSYNDLFVQTGQTYTYRVTAKGVKGETTSDDYNIMPVVCEQPPPPPPPTPPPTPAPTVEKPKIVQLIFGGNIVNSDTPVIPRTNKTRPSFSGIVDTPNAKILLVLVTKKRVYINIVSNNNGYWRLKKFPKKLKKGTYNLNISVINPSDSSIIQSYLLTFRIGKKKWVGSGNTPPNYFRKANFTSPQNYIAKSLNPLEISQKGTSWLAGYQDQTIKSTTAYLGKNFEGETVLDQSIVANNSNVPINYKIVDLKGSTVLAETEKAEKNIFSIKIPYNLKEGKYKLVASADARDYYLSNEIPFQIKELPLVTLGQNTKLTCGNLINYTGWIAAISFATLVLVSILTLIEYHLSKDAPLHISEDELEREGLIS